MYFAIKHLLVCYENNKCIQQSFFVGTNLQLGLWPCHFYELWPHRIQVHQRLVEADPVVAGIKGGGCGVVVIPADKEELVLL
jgi:hypothetical protein